MISDWGAKAGTLQSVWRTVFGSAGPRWFGARSYCVYVIHWPIIQLVLFAIFQYGAPGRWTTFAILLPGVVVGVLLAAEALHRLVERPSIRLGSRLAKRLGDSDGRLGQWRPALRPPRP